MSADPFFDEEPTHEQALATLDLQSKCAAAGMDSMQFQIEAARQQQEFAFGWLLGARTSRSMRVRKVAWEIATGSIIHRGEAARRLGISRQCLHRAIARCRRYRRDWRKS